MTNTTLTVTDTWTQVSDNVDYMIQNVTQIGSRAGSNDGLVRVKASDVQPTDDSGAFELRYGDVLTSGMLSGTVWVKRASNGLTTLTVAT